MRRAASRYATARQALGKGASLEIVAQRENPKQHHSAFFIYTLCLLVISIASCTVIPKKVQSTSPSFSGTNFNSGFRFNADKTGHIDDRTRERYNELIDIYGGKFLPRLRPDEGLSKEGDGWRIDQEHLVKLLRMDRWHREDNPR